MELKDKLYISELRSGITSGSDIKELACMLLSRIRERDLGPEGFDSMSVIDPDLLFNAEALALKKDKGIEGPLAGVPVVIKANIGTRDRMPTTAGSEALKDLYNLRDSAVAERLRSSGALLTGKANMTEFANFMSYNMPSGYSSLGGQVINPENRNAPPGGSSSGVAAAVAAGLACIGIGTETNGSIIWPAQMCGVAGLKPSIGLISRRGILPICSTLDTAGPIAADVEGCAAAMNVLAGYDPEDPATFIMKDKAPIDFTACLDEDCIKGKRIGVFWDKTYVTTDEQLEAARELIGLMKALGAEIIDGLDLKEETNVQATEMYEFKNCLNEYLSKECPGGLTLQKILDYNMEHAGTALRYGQARIQDAQNATGRMTEPEYVESLLAREEQIRKINGMMDDLKLDAILCGGGISNLPPFTGFPAMTIPIASAKNGTPIGCCMMARHLDDAQLLGIMYSLEKHIDHK